MLTGRNSFYYIHPMSLDKKNVEFQGGSRSALNSSDHEIEIGQSGALMLS